MVDMLGFMQPRFWFAFWAASPDWHLMSNFFIHHNSKILLCRAALNPFIASLYWYWNVQTQVQDLVLGPVEFHRDHTGWLLKPAKVPLTGSPSPPCVNCTTQLGAVHKLADVHSILLCCWWGYEIVLVLIQTLEGHHWLLVSTWTLSCWLFLLAARESIANPSN